jgi:Right handed beta helix region
MQAKTEHLNDARNQAFLVGLQYPYSPFRRRSTMNDFGRNYLATAVVVRQLFSIAIASSLAVIVAAQELRAETFIVTSSADSGSGSLREAINTANLRTGKDMITFNIASTDRTIILLSPLSEIIDPVIIDGLITPPTGEPFRVELSGVQSGEETSGLTFKTDHSELRNLVIKQFKEGIRIEGGNNAVEGCYVGISEDGQKVVGNGIGIIVAGETGIGNTIGGSASSQRNVISGNQKEGVLIFSGASNNLIEGNFVGVNSAGTAAIPNGSGIKTMGIGDTIRGNLISGNNGTAVSIFGSSVSVLNNLIGTNSSGDSALPNFDDGVDIPEGKDTIIKGNVISANLSSGVVVRSSISKNALIQGNWIGTDKTGTKVLGNGNGGVMIQETATNNRIGGILPGEANIIAYNLGGGVKVIDGGTLNNFITGNQFYNNQGLEIDLGGDGPTPNDFALFGGEPDQDTGPNNLQNRPELLIARTDSMNQITTLGFFLPTAPSTYRIELYASTEANNEESGKAYLGAFDVTVSQPVVAFSYGLNVRLPFFLPQDLKIAAIATDLTGNTSEFSNTITVQPFPRGRIFEK